MAVMSACGNRVAHSIDCAVLNIAPVSTPALHGAFVHNCPGAERLHRTDIRIDGAEWLSLNQFEKEDETGWTFELVLITSLLPFLIFSGQESPVNVSAKLREGTPYLSLAYLANFSLFFHHLF